MRQLIKGMFARSLAGHDKGKLYVIMETDETYVYLTDGKLRPLNKLKKKKRKHIQPDYEIAEVLQERIKGQFPIRDEDIQRAIKVKEV